MSNEPHAEPGRPPAHVRYPSEYTWLVFAASLDLMLTWVVLHRGGREVNVIADFVIQRSGIWGLSLFKFGIIVLVICLCETVGRRRPPAGRFLALTAVALNCVPVVIAAFLLLTR